MTAQIEINGRKYTAKSRTVGVNFGTEATVRIGGKAISSATYPLGCDSQALESLVAKVRRMYGVAAQC